MQARSAGFRLSLLRSFAFAACHNRGCAYAHLRCRLLKGVSDYGDEMNHCSDKERRNRHAGSTSMLPSGS